MWWKRELEIFLGGTFHQDIESIEDEVCGYLVNMKKNAIKTINAIDEFLESSMSTEEKNKFIKDNTEIYFPAIEKEPVEWLQEVNDFFKSKISEF